MLSSDDENTEDGFRLQKLSRLGDCEVCASKEAIYTCPKCEVKTCCLSCVRLHKKELECDGIRDRTKFIRIKDFTDTDLLSDYRLLEECARFAWSVKRDVKKRFTKDNKLPIHLFKLKAAARQRGIVLQFLTQNFTKHKCNTTRYNFKTNIINWRVELIFPNVDVEPLKYVEENIPEQTKLSQLLDKYLNCDTVPFDGSKYLTYYKSVGFSGVKILLKAEKVHGSCKKFFELDTTESLAENLSGKCIVEFPIMFIVLKDHAYNFDIIEPETEFEEKNEQTCKLTQQNIKDVNKEGKAKILNGDNTVSHDNTSQPHNSSYRKRPRQLLTQKIAEEKQMAIQKEIKAERKKRPKNLLFTTGYSSEESLSDCSSGNNE